LFIIYFVETCLYKKLKQLLILTKYSLPNSYNELIQIEGGEVRIVIYLDVLFLVNLFMDSLILILVSKFLKYTATYFRIITAATLGAIWACIAVTIPIHYIFLRNICTYILISFVMIRICAKKCDLKDMIKGVVTLYLVTFTVGGMCHMIYYYTNAGYYINTVILNDKLLVAAIVMAGILLMAISRYLDQFIAYNSKVYNVILKVGEKQICIKGILDTGNVLQDPYFHKPVNVIEYQAFENIFNNIEDCTKVKYHMIPFRSLGCSEGCIEVIMVDVMYIYRNEKTITKKEALVGLYKQKLSSDNAYQMLLNSECFR